MQANEEFSGAAGWNAIIDKIPDEGGLEMNVPGPAAGKGTYYKFTPDGLKPAILRPFEGKTPPVPDDRTMTITIGAPGCGKSRRAKKRFQLLPEHIKETTAGISYDEDIAGKDGAIYNTPHFVETLSEIEPAFREQHTPVPVESLDPRRQLWKGFQL